MTQTSERQADIDLICQSMSFSKTKDWRSQPVWWNGKKGKESRYYSGHFDPFAKPADCARIKAELRARGHSYEICWRSHFNTHRVYIYYLSGTVTTEASIEEEAFSNAVLKLIRAEGGSKA